MVVKYNLKAELFNEKVKFQGGCRMIPQVCAIPRYLRWKAKVSPMLPGWLKVEGCK